TCAPKPSRRVAVARDVPLRRSCAGGEPLVPATLSTKGVTEHGVAAGKILTKRANHHARGARSLRRTPDEARLGAWSRVGLVILGVLIGALAGELLARLVGFEFRP